MGLLLVNIIKLKMCCARKNILHRVCGFTVRSINTVPAEVTIRVCIIKYKIENENATCQFPHDNVLLLKNMNDTTFLGQNIHASLNVLLLKIFVEVRVIFKYITNTTIHNIIIIFFQLLYYIIYYLFYYMFPGQLLTR